MGIEIKLSGDNWTEIDALLGSRVETVEVQPLNFQAVVASFGARCEAEGYDFEIWKKGEARLPSEPEEKKSVAEAKREEARAKLKDDLKASLKPTETAETPLPSPKKGKKNGAEDPEATKVRVIGRLHELFDKNKTAIMKILADHGGGAKNFNAVPVENFPAISTALAELEATL